MFPSKPDLVILPFKAALIGSDNPLTLEQALLLLRKHEPIQIECSQPGAPDAIGWTIFRRTPRKYLYEFRFERGACCLRSVRKAYAIHYSLLGDDGMTLSHLHL